MHQKTLKNYEDIIDWPHAEPKQHIRMERYKRAAQFAPFAALKGHEDAINEEKRVTDEKKILDESEKEVLDIKLKNLRTGEFKEEAKIIYFIKDEKKSGGKYVTYIGRIKKIDETRHSIIIEDEKEVPVENIVEIEKISIDKTEELY